MASLSKRQKIEWRQKDRDLDLLSLPNDALSQLAAFRRTNRLSRNLCMVPLRNCTHFDVQTRTEQVKPMIKVGMLAKKLEDVVLVQTTMLETSMFVKKYCRSLRSLKISDPNITEFHQVRDMRILQAIGDSCPNLESLTISCVFTHEELINFKLPKLKQLILHQTLCANVNAKDYRGPRRGRAQRFTGITEIVQDFQPQHFRQFAQNCPNVENLYMNMLRPAFLVEMETMTKLKVLQLQNFKRDRLAKFYACMNVVVQKHMFPDLLRILVAEKPTAKQLYVLRMYKPNCLLLRKQ